jgi:hypothetical protein
LKYWAAARTGNRPIPIKLMMGVKDSLRIDKIQVKRGRIKPSTDQLTVQGGFSAKNIDVNMAASDSIVNLGGQTFAIPAGKFRSNKNKDKFTCSNVKLSDGSIASADFNFRTCTFSVVIKNTKIIANSGSANFGVEFTGFSAGIDIVVP